MDANTNNEELYTSHIEAYKKYLYVFEDYRKGTLNTDAVNVRSKIGRWIEKASEIKSTVSKGLVSTAKSLTYNDGRPSMLEKQPTQ